jgi:hypothetical protein
MNSTNKEDRAVETSTRDHDNSVDNNERITARSVGSSSMTMSCLTGQFWIKSLADNLPLIFSTLNPRAAPFVPCSQPTKQLVRTTTPVPTASAETAAAQGGTPATDQTPKEGGNSNESRGKEVIPSEEVGVRADDLQKEGVTSEEWATSLSLLEEKECGGG